MDDDTYQRLSRIDEYLMELCRWLNERRDTAMASRLIPITDDLTRVGAINILGFVLLNISQVRF
jgi:hypothetical protein